MQGLKWESPENIGTKSDFSPSLLYFSHDLIWFHPNACFFFSFFFLFYSFFFSSTHVYSYLSSLYLHLHFCISTSTLSFFVFHSIFIVAPTKTTSENTVNKIPPKISSIAPKCPKTRKHKPTAHKRLENTNTNPHRCWA